MVDGRPAKLGQKVDPAIESIKYKRKVVRNLKPQDSLVYALHKPRGVVSSSKDPEGRTRVVDLVPKGFRVFPVGRLDINSEGLILLTNDGKLALKLTHPRYEIAKTYEVKVRGSLDDKRLDFLKRGFSLGPVKYRGAEILGLREVTQDGVRKHVVKIRIREGKNHHVRKMFEAVNCRVVRLKRIAIGGYEMKGLAKGEFKKLSRHELERLMLNPEGKH